MCGCSKTNAMFKQQQQQLRSNLGVSRAQLVTPPPQAQAQMRMAMSQPVQPKTQLPLNSNDRRRIQQLNQEAIRRSLGKK